MQFNSAATAHFASAAATALAGGSIELLSSTGQVLATISGLSSPAGVVSGNVLSLSGFPRSGTVALSGTPAAAQIRTAAGALFASGASVGLPASNAEVRLDVRDASGNSTGALAMTQGQSFSISASPTLTITGV